MTDKTRTQPSPTAQNPAHSTADPRPGAAASRPGLGVLGAIAACLCGAGPLACGDDTVEGSGSSSSSSSGTATTTGTDATSEPPTTTGVPTTSGTPDTTSTSTTDATSSSTTDATSSSTTAVTVTTGSSSSTGAPVSCGDTIVDEGEECDDGNPDNTDDCLDTCLLATCGDGELQAGVEACDDGNADNFDGCTNTCQALVCGDALATRGSPIALTPDDSRLVVANRDNGSVSILSVDYMDLPAMTLVDEIAVGGEPWQVVLDRCGATAYAVLRRDQSVVEIVDVLGVPTLGKTVAVGSEPTALALTPNGTRLYVANWVDGTLTVVDPTTMTATGVIDLNAALVDDPSKFLGDVAARPALAHPRSLAITSDGDGDDTDEKVYVTEYFAQRSAPEAMNGSNGDINWVGVVYSVKVADDSVALIQLPPVLDTGFPNTLMQPTGCFPNQLQAVTIAGDFAYVSSICASPVGPIGPKVNTHPLISVIDTTSDTLVPAGTANIDRNFDAQYAMKATPDTSARRFPHVPADLSVDPVSGEAYIAANGADALFRTVHDPVTGALVSVGKANAPDFIDLSPAALKQTPKAGQNPVGVVVARAQPFAFVTNDVTMNVSAIDLEQQIVAGSDINDARVAQSGALPVDPDTQSILRGKRFFNTGLGRWSFNGQAWGSCQACHGDGLSDNVTWYFAKGPRQSTSLEGSYAKGDPSDHRVFLWTAVFDEIADVENNTRGVSGGVGALVSFADPMMDPKLADRIDLTSAALFPPAGAVNLNGSTQAIVDGVSVLKDWNDITRYVQTIRPPRAPSNLDPALVSAGEALFKNVASGGVCQGCHGGNKWTISRVFYTPSSAGNEALKTKAWDQATLLGAGFPAALLPATTAINQRMRFGNPANDQLQCIVRPVGTFGVAPPAVGVAELRADMVTAAQGNATDSNGYNPPSLLGLQVGAPFFHAGNARTLEELLSPTFAAHRQALTKNPNYLVPAGDVDKLVAYLLSIDGDKPPLPTPPPGPQGGDFCQP